MIPHVCACLCIVLLGTGCPHNAEVAALRCAMISPSAASSQRIAQLKQRRFNSVAIDVTDDKSVSSLPEAARRVRSSKLGLYYWIEIGRNPAMADAHPEWMASLQGHPEWRRLFANAPMPGAGEVVKNYPWTPIYYRETFDAHLSRITKLLSELPHPDGIFLNDLQAAPSACGCGNTLCRWTTDYGPISTATRLGNDAAGRFIAEVKKLAPGIPIIPVWLSECEEDEKKTHCAGVGCFEGTCWYSLTEQLMLVAGQCDRIGAMLFTKTLGKDAATGVQDAGWIARAISSFAEMPPKRKGSAIPPKRMVAVLQGWDTSQKEIEAQIDQCRRAGAGGYVVAFAKIDQSWEPKLYKLNAANPSGAIRPTPAGNRAASH